MIRFLDDASFCSILLVSFFPRHFRNHQAKNTLNLSPDVALHMEGFNNYLDVASFCSPLLLFYFCVPFFRGIPATTRQRAR